MPILSRTSRRSPGRRAVWTGICAMLALGAAGIVCPVLIVLAQTMSDRYGLRDNAIVPYYLTDRNELALKHVLSFTTRIDWLAGRHNRNEWTSRAALRDDADFYSTRPAALKQMGLSLEAWQTIVADLQEFKATMNSDDLVAKEFRIEDYFRPFLRDRYGRRADALLAAYEQTGRPPEWLERAVPEADARRRLLADHDRLGVAIMNHDLGSDYLSYDSVAVPKPGSFLEPFWRPGGEARDILWSDFKASLPPEQLMIVSSDSYWHEHVRQKYGTIGALNGAWGTEHEGFHELKVPLLPPVDTPAMRADWDEFIIQRWPRRLLEVPWSGQFILGWQQHVRKRLLGKMRGDADEEERALREAAWLAVWGLTSWDEVPLPATQPEDEAIARYWNEYTSSGAIPAGQFILHSPELAFRRFARRKYGPEGASSSQPAGQAEDHGLDGSAALAALNDAWGTRFESFHFVPLPLALADYAPVRYTPGELRWSMATESYRRVWEHLAGRGRAIGGAVILVLCALICALKVKPILAFIALNTLLLGYGGFMWAFALRPGRRPGAPVGGAATSGPAVPQAIASSPRPSWPPCPR